MTLEGIEILHQTEIMTTPWWYGWLTMGVFFVVLVFLSLMIAPFT